MSKPMGQAPPRNKKFDRKKEEIRRIKYEHESFKPDPVIQRLVDTDQLGGYVAEEEDGFNNHMVRNNHCPICGAEWIPYCNKDVFCAISYEYGKAVLVCRVHEMDLRKGCTKCVWRVRHYITFRPDWHDRGLGRKRGINGGKYRKEPVYRHYQNKICHRKSSLLKKNYLSNSFPERSHLYPEIQNLLHYLALIRKRHLCGSYDPFYWYSPSAAITASNGGASPIRPTA